MSLRNHSSLMPSENRWKYSSCSYSDTTRGLNAVHVVRHSLIFSTLVVDITIDRCSLVLSLSCFSAFSYLLVVMMLGIGALDLINCTLSVV